MELAEMLKFYYKIEEPKKEVPEWKVPNPACGWPTQAIPKSTVNLPQEVVWVLLSCIVDGFYRMWKFYFIIIYFCSIKFLISSHMWKFYLAIKSKYYT